MDDRSKRVIDAVIARSTFRKNVHRLIPEGASRILDFGCGDGSLAFRLMRDKQCSEIHALEVNKKLTKRLEGKLSGVWNINIERQNEDLPDSLAGFFNYIILHDVVEHFYDPWYCLAKLRRFLAPGGRLILATPNVQFWDFAHKILSGDFPYGPGLWHTGHLRWYTVKSLIELTTVTGYAIETIHLEIPYQLDRSVFEPPRARTSLQLPPAEIAGQHPDVEPIGLNFARDIGAGYPLFFAHKMIFTCGARPDMVVKADPMVYNCPGLKKLRDMLDNPFDTHSPPPMELLIGDWN